MLAVVASISDTQITRIVVVGCGAIGVACYVGLLLVPAWRSYSRVWQRLAASFLSLYVLAAGLGLGLLAAGATVWFWDRITG